MQGSLGLVVAAEGGYDGGVVMRRMEMMHVVIVSENHNASDLEGIRRCHNTNRKRNNQIGVFGKAGGWWLSVSRSRSTLKSKGRLCCQRRKCRKEKEKEPRNLKLGLASDGMSPYGTLSTQHNSWPVLLVIYNLPPWV